MIESKKINKVSSLILHKKSPIGICWNLTSSCNRNCKYCYRITSCNDLPLNKNIIILEKLINAGIKKITFAGGEPLLYEGLLELISLANSRGVLTSISTNGTYLDESVLFRLAKILDWITLTLNTTSNINELRMSGDDSIGNKIEILENIKTILSKDYGLASIMSIRKGRPFNFKSNSSRKWYRVY